MERAYNHLGGAAEGLYAELLDLGLAWQALGEHQRNLQKRVLEEIGRLESDVADRVLAALPADP